MSHRSLTAATLALALLSVLSPRSANAELPPFSRVHRLHFDAIEANESDEAALRLMLRAENAKGTPITDLRAVDLSINQDGAPFGRDAIRLEKLGATDARLRCVIVLDVSRVMRGAPFEAAKKAAIQLADALQARQDEVAVVVFGGEARVLSPFSDAPEEQRVRLEQLEVQANSLSTTLYDGVADALESIEGPSGARARFVVLFSDGEDDGSVRGLDDVLALATVGEKAAAIPILSVAYSRVGGTFDALGELARVSNGALTPVASPDEIAGAFEAAFERVRNAYVVHVDASLDGQGHDISVAVEDVRATRRVVYPEGSSRLPMILGIAAATLVVLGVVALVVARLRARPSGQLVFVDGPRAGQEVPIRQRLRIGAQADNDLVVDDETVSRHHAEVRARGGALEIEDLGSTNGTLVNGERIAQPQRLQPGDRVHIASLQLVVRA